MLFVDDLYSRVRHIPLALYIHMPWCVKKCPYCDFNSHQIPEEGMSQTLEETYLTALIADFKSQQHWLQGRMIRSVFVGGGTPSLISAAGYVRLFAAIKQLSVFAPDCEITLEANPGTLEHQPFSDYLAAGINRLSLGVPTCDDALLTTLGRVHSSGEALDAIQRARAAGFERLNVDLMHGLPAQTVVQAMQDLQLAMDAGATHISWYQLTIEPNTVFFRTQPTLPDEDRLADIQAAGEALLIKNGFIQYEVSAWAKERPSQHNLNYWQFGDYLAIGAGAHGKISVPRDLSIDDASHAAIEIFRFQKSRLPKDYLAQTPAPNIQHSKIETSALPFEFMMNALRLKQGVDLDCFSARTGLAIDVIQPQLMALRTAGLLQQNNRLLACTPLGYRYLNSVLEHFLTDD